MDAIKLEGSAIVRHEAERVASEFGADHADAIALHAAADRLAVAEQITREDVALLGRASVIFRIGDVESATDEGATRQLRAFAAKIAALLPPE